MAASSSTWVVVQSRNYTFLDIFGVLRPFYALLLVGKQSRHLGIREVFSFAAFFDIFKAIIGTNFGTNGQDTEVPTPSRAQKLSVLV